MTWMVMDLMPGFGLIPRVSWMANGEFTKCVDAAYALISIRICWLRCYFESVALAKP